MPIVFIFLPFLAFLMCLKDLRKPQNAIVFIAFYALFGYANHFDLKTADISRIAYSFQYNGYSHDIFRSIELYLIGAAPDVYKNLLMSIISIFTNNPKVFCAAIALIYGILSYAVYVKIYKLWNKPYDKNFYIYILVALSNISLVQLTGMRFFTGALLFILSSYNFVNSNKLWIIGILLTPFIHFSQWVAVAGFFIYLVGYRILKHKTLCKLILILCLFFSFINLRGVSKRFFGQMEVKSEALNRKAGAYMNEANSKTMILRQEQSTYREANSIFTSIFEIICRVGLALTLLKLLNKQDIFRQSSKKYSFFSLCYVFSCISILLMGINDEIKRFICISWGLTLLYIAYIKGQNSSFKIQNYLGLIVFSNFYWICYLFINAPRLVDISLWFLPMPYIIIDGIGYRI